MRIILLGAPGSGKVTQAMKLSEHFGISWITTSQLLHDAAKGHTIPGMRAKAFLNMGQHVPDEIVYAVLKERLDRPDIHNGFLLVGFPRTAYQANILDELLEQLDLPLDLVLLLEGDPDHFMERLEGRCFCQTCGAMYNDFSNPPKVEGMCNLCGGPVRRRSEDNEETIAHRIRSYEQQVSALIHYYKLHGKLRQVSAVETSDRVYDALRSIVQEQPSAGVNTGPVLAVPVPLAGKPARNNGKDAKQADSQEEISSKKKATVIKKKTKTKRPGTDSPINPEVMIAPSSKKRAVSGKKTSAKNKEANKSVLTKHVTKKKKISTSRAVISNERLVKKKTAKTPTVKKVSKRTTEKKKKGISEKKRDQKKSLK